jgi:hypothetical protein
MRLPRIVVTIFRLLLRVGIVVSLILLLFVGVFPVDAAPADGLGHPTPACSTTGTRPKADRNEMGAACRAD